LFYFFSIQICKEKSIVNKQCVQKLLFLLLTAVFHQGLDTLKYNYVYLVFPKKINESIRQIIYSTAQRNFRTAGRGERILIIPKPTTGHEP
jgi:hypothetical protein